jgi:hypothetical protein
MLADEQTRREIRALVDATYEAMSTPGSNVGEIIGEDDITIAGSGQSELWSGPDEVVAAATVVSSWGFRWTPEKVTVWRRGEVAWRRFWDLFAWSEAASTNGSRIGLPGSSAWTAAAGVGSTGADLNRRSRRRSEPSLARPREPALPRASGVIALRLG